ncbi:MAG: peptidylprolyl isomerase [Simplicispira sp.]|uniref:peptidylprolyl isomerase n=1 Tax=Simplicispira sp. TaxID=2015802 RepID=UPI0025864608|nr:peptidylprolyl isomerase [Simplicispira sp.]MDD2691729.1 peptidylprolyl isomerase [Simplicispira sp.]
MLHLLSSPHRSFGALRPLTAHFALAAALLAAPTFGQSKSEVLMQGAGAKIETSDVQAELQRLPAAARERVLAQPDMLRQLISNLYLRRAFALEAERQGLPKTTEVQHKLQTARENALAEVLAEHIATAATPDTTAADKLAATIYKAEPQRFAVPAQTRARHILIQGATPEARAQADKLLAELKAGANFEELAKAHSADPGSAAKGGDLGLFPKGRMVKPFEEALDALQNPGDLSGVVQSNFGYHIIRLEERQPAGTKPFDEVREQLRAEVVNKAQQDARMKEVERLRAQAKGDETAFEAFLAAQKQQLPATTAPAAAPTPTK